MFRTTLTTILILSAAALLAWSLGGLEGTGVLVGALGGAMDVLGATVVVRRRG